MKKFLLMLVFALVNCTFAQNLNNNYGIVVKSKNFKNEILESKLETIGFLPVYDNHKDEIIIGNTKIIKESFLNIQIIDEKNNIFTVVLDYRNDEKNYKKTIEITSGKFENMNDFEIKVEKK